MDKGYTVIYDYYDKDGGTEFGFTVDFETEEEAKEWIRKGTDDSCIGNFTLCSKSWE